MEPTVQVIEPHKVEYPDGFTFWKTKVPQSEQLTIINPGDFPKESILEGLGLHDSKLKHSFGITDRTEIVERQELIRFFIENPWMHDMLSRSFNDEFPMSHSEFLQYYDPRKQHNPYWQGIINFIKLVESCKFVPRRLERFVEFLSGSLELEKAEREMADLIAVDVEKITVFEGLMDVTVDFNLGEPMIWLHEENIFVRGHKAFSYALNAIPYKKYPEWTDNKYHPGNWIGIGRIAKAMVDWQNNRAREKAYKSMVIRESSDELWSDLRAGLSSLLTDAKIHVDLQNLALKVYFTYSQQGLQLRIIDVDTTLPESYDVYQFEQYQGYSKKDLELVHEAREDIKQAMHKGRHASWRDAARTILEGNAPHLFEKMNTVESSSCDRKYRWYAMENLYSRPVCKKTYEAVKAHHRYVRSKITELLEIAKAAKIFKETAKKLKAPICYPEILDNGKHMVSFEEIYPLHLVRRHGSKVIPIRRLPEINGNLIGLTGFHGGGKTVTELSVTDNIWLACSGLPILGKGMRLDPKTHLGMVFIERGDGSTCELLLDKTKSILEGIDQANGGSVVLILDEIGTGTQESSGLELGRDLLYTLSKKGVSVLFSTQITELAEYAERELEAQCFQVDEDHRIEPGIGAGGMDRLRKKKGLDKLLQTAN